jgi:hypothetical protein
VRALTPPALGTIPGSNFFERKSSSQFTGAALHLLTSKVFRARTQVTVTFGYFRPLTVSPELISSWLPEEGGGKPSAAVIVS